MDQDKLSLIEHDLRRLYKQEFQLRQALREEQEKAKAANEELFRELLEIFDALEFLINYIEDNPEVNEKFIKRLPKSIITIQKKLLIILARRQVNLIEYTDKKPDFTVCHVVDCELREDIEEHTITKIVRKGFYLGNKLLRPVEVITTKH